MTQELINERESSHGDYGSQSQITQTFKTVIRSSSLGLSYAQQEALEMIAMKMARIMSGDPSHKDHWDDIAGYAMLGKGVRGQSED